MGDRLLPALALGLSLTACGPSPGDQPLALRADQSARTLANVTAPPQSAAPDPQAVVQAMSSGDAFEIAAAKLALQRSQTRPVRVFAATMAHDHAASSADLKAALAAAGQPFAAAAAPSSEQQAVLARLSAAPPQDFDRAYVRAQVDAHAQALQALQPYAEAGEVTSLRAVASTAAGAAQRHYAMAEQLKDQLERQ